MRIKLRIAGEDLLRDGRVIKLREALDSFHGNATDGKEFLAIGPEVRVVGLNERQQGDAALLGEGFVIQGNLAHGFQGQAVAEQHIELADGLKGGGVSRRYRRDKLIPRGRLLRLTPTFEPFHQARDKWGVTIRHISRTGQEFI